VLELVGRNRDPSLIVGLVIDTLAFESAADLDQIIRRESTAVSEISASCWRERRDSEIAGHYQDRDCDAGKAPADKRTASQQRLPRSLDPASDACQRRGDRQPIEAPHQPSSVRSPPFHSSELSRTHSRTRPKAKGRPDALAPSGIRAHPWAVRSRR